MVVETELGRFGFVVDQVLGNHQTVIKNLGPGLPQRAGCLRRHNFGQWNGRAHHRPAAPCARRRPGCLPPQAGRATFMSGVSQYVSNVPVPRC